MTHRKWAGNCARLLGVPKPPKRIGYATNKRRDMDLGIAICGALTAPGQCRTLAEIAAFAGCTKQAISLIEQSAFQKIRRAYRHRPEKIAELMNLRAPIIHPTGFSGWWKHE